MQTRHGVGWILAGIQSGGAEIGIGPGHDTSRVQNPDGEFVRRAIENNLLVIPGSIFSQRDTHFRISYAAADATIERGIEVLRQLAK